MSENLIPFGSSISANFSISPQAFHVLEKYIQDNQAVGLYFSVEAGGCSGYKYDLSLAYAPVSRSGSSEQVITEGEKSISIFTPLLAIPLLQGTEIWYDSKLVGGGIKFINPNAKRKCGCGESFS